MCPKIRISVLSLLIVVTALSLTGCCGVFSSMPWCPDVPEPTDAEIAARIEIKKNRELAEAAVSEIKEKFKGKETKTSYVTAKDLYIKAMSENNAWLSVLASSIENNENLEKADSFKKQSKIAADTAGSFLAYGRELLISKPGAEKAVFATKSLALAPIADLITALVANGITIWKANMAQRAQARRDRADNIRKDLSWKTWKQIE
ncbi:MAG: hypothetical protein PHP73_01225 [Candidatus Omnitrophica bacterium]|nr:hypothetical protein [Candidatus Omnitrophota bacterium]